MDLGPGEPAAEPDYELGAAWGRADGQTMDFRLTIATGSITGPAQPGFFVLDTSVSADK